MFKSSLCTADITQSRPSSLLSGTGAMSITAAICGTSIAIGSSTRRCHGGISPLRSECVNRVSHGLSAAHAPTSSAADAHGSSSSSSRPSSSGATSGYDSCRVAGIGRRGRVSYSNAVVVIFSSAVNSYPIVEIIIAAAVSINTAAGWCTGAVHFDFTVVVVLLLLLLLRGRRVLCIIPLQTPFRVLL